MTTDITTAISTLTHGVYILGVHADEKENLMTAAWLCQVSGNPPTLAVAVSSGHLTADLIRQSGNFTVSVLASDQKNVAIACGTVSGRKADKTAVVDMERTMSGIPIIKNAIAQLECKVIDVNTITGNHTIFIAEVVGGSCINQQKLPLLYHPIDFFGA